LLEIAAGFTSIGTMIEEMILEPILDKVNDQEEDYVTLSTVHSAKGLEWDTVFVVRVEDKSFPTARSMEDREQLEEEYRLMYVAITRAKHRLLLMTPSGTRGCRLFNTTKIVELVDEKRSSCR